MIGKDFKHFYLIFSLLGIHSLSKPADFATAQQGLDAATDTARQAGLNAIAAFRGAGRGSVTQLLQDRQADRLAELRKEQAVPAVQTP